MNGLYVHKLVIGAMMENDCVLIGSSVCDVIVIS